MRKQLMILVSICFFSNLYATERLGDTTSFLSNFEIGTGGFMGSHSFVPKTKGFTFNYILGVDHGVFVRVLANIDVGISASIDLRYTTRTATLNFSNNSLYEFFTLKETGIQIPLLVSYAIRTKRKQEILSFFTGVAYNNIKYEASNGSYATYVRSVTTAIGKEYFNGIDAKYYSVLFGVSKKFKLHSNLDLLVFNECELKENGLLIKNGFLNINQNVYERHDTNYRALSIRLGICILY